MKKNAGFTLIEVLIAMLVLAVGLLGLAGLQATGLNNNQRAYYRSQSTQLTYEIADRMRANRSAATSYLSASMDPTTATAKPLCLATTGCSTADMAENDLFEWNRTVRVNLPSGEGTITSVAGAPNMYLIEITLDGDRDGDDSNNLHFQTSFQL